MVGKTFNDVLILPKFSKVRSRKEVSLSTTLGSNVRHQFELPIISANMDTLTGPEMCIAMHKAGGIGCLHRFYTHDENVNDYLKVREAGAYCAVSVGLGVDELKRASELYEASARFFIIDVAHGAQAAVVEQYEKLKHMLPDIYLVVGNFATAESVSEFMENCKYPVDAVKVGVGPGSTCITRTKTGVGFPQLSAIQEVNELRLHSKNDFQIIADGGCKTPGDIAKALAAGADMVMLGGMLAGTDESPGKGVFRGSASRESYADQNKTATWRTAEGVAAVVRKVGPVSEILSDIEGGLRSSFSYVGAFNLEQFQERAKFVDITQSSYVEGTAHIKGDHL